MKLKYVTEIEMTREEIIKGLSNDLNTEVDENSSIEELTSLLEEVLDDIQTEEAIKISNVELLED